MIAFIAGLILGSAITTLIIAAVITGANPVPRNTVQHDIDEYLGPRLAQQGPFELDDLRWEGTSTKVEGWE